MTLIAGAPNMAKSQIALDIAARLSNGDNWPDGGRAPHGSTIILSAEDAAADDTLRPRLEAAGADLEHVYYLKAAFTDDGKRRTFSLQADLGALAQKIAALNDVLLVVIDPITSYMGARVDSHRTTDVRAVLEPLADFADQCDVAVLAISHPPKHAPTKAINAVTGSLAFVAAARLVLFAIEEPDSDRRLLVPVKNNLGALPAGLGYRCAQRIVSREIVAPYVEWDRKPVTVSADQALAASASAVGEANKLADAKDFLADELMAGPRLATEIKQRAEAEGITERTLRRARDALHVKVAKDGYQGNWVWRLPTTAAH